MAAPVRVDLAEAYHEDSKYRTYELPRLMAGVALFPSWVDGQRFNRRPSKAYPGSPVLELPRPSGLRASLAHVLGERRSEAPGDGPLTPRQLATLLWAAQGLRLDGKRTVPSAGGLYPLELYVAVRDVRGVAEGLHHYDPLLHCLERLGDGSASGWYLQEGEFDGAAAHIIVTCVMPRLAIKYRERAYRFGLQEAGHAAQNLLLAAASLRLACLPVGGFRDDAVHDALVLDGVEEVGLCILPVGRRRRGPARGPKTRLLSP